MSLCAERREETLQRLEVAFEQSSEKVKSLSHDSPQVLAQYDHFASNLKQRYIAGEGLIDKDVFHILDALLFAAEKHQFQTRKDIQQTPYIIHPIGVANHLIVIGQVRDPDIIMGALLHDTVEDTATTFEEIDVKFGPRVTSLVREVTDDKSLPKQDRKLLQIVNASKKSAGAAQIKLADKYYNLTDLLNAPPPDWDQERVTAYFAWAKAVVDQLPWVNAPLKQSIDQTIDAYKDAGV